MHTPYRKRLSAVFALASLIIAVVLSCVPAFAAPDEGGRVPYQYSMEKLNGRAFSGTMIGVVRDLHLPRGEVITAEGWLATAEGISAYQYLWLPSSGGEAEWQTITDAEITARKDLSPAKVPYESGHSTAGFHLTITPPEGLSEGVYDVYIRALDGMGTPCDLVALLELRYGDPDVDDGRKCAVSFPRIQREGEASVRGDASVGASEITLNGEGRVRLGEFNLASFEQLRITYTLSGDSDPGDGRRAILGLKSGGDHGYGLAGEAYNLTDSLAYAAPDSSEGVLNMDLTACNHYGEVWLTGYLGGTVTITGIELIYNGCAADRVAAKIFLSEDLAGEYFFGKNFTDVYGVQDPVLGDVLRMEVTEKTNDPFAFFNASKVLAEQGIALDADEYKYMVFLYRAEETINADRMNLYLCSGPITGATEECNQGVTLQRDGKWHYLLVDLSQKANWGGLINGWRFDYVSADSDPGDAVEFATVQFFRTPEAARKAAAQDPAGQTPFHLGDSAVLRDMSEEGGEADKDPFVIPPEDSYVVTEPETSAPVEPETVAPTVTVPTVDTAESAAEAGSSGGGCRSAVAGGLFSALIAVAVWFLARKKD